MSLFICEQCGCLENTALCHYWNRGTGKALCSACDPKIGKWHELFDRRFPKEDDLKDKRLMVNRNGKRIGGLGLYNKRDKYKCKCGMKFWNKYNFDKHVIKCEEK